MDLSSEPILRHRLEPLHLSLESLTVAKGKGRKKIVVVIIVVIEKEKPRNLGEKKSFFKIEIKGKKLIFKT